MSSKWIGLMLLTGMILCTAAACAQDSTLRVVGVGSIQVPADTTIIAFEVQNNSDNLTLAQESASLQLNRTEEALVAAGVKSEEILEHRFKGRLTSRKMICSNVNNTTDCREVIVNAATMRLVIKLKTSDANQTRRVIEAGRSAGARAAIWGYELNDSSIAIDQARKNALENAKAKAEYYASSYGLALGESVEMEEPAYPDIEVGPGWGGMGPWRMSRMHRMWMDPFHGMEGFWRDSYIQEGMAEVTAYVRATYQVRNP